MKKIFFSLFTLLMFTNPTFACPSTNSSIEVCDVWTRPKTQSSTAGGVFLTLKNTDKKEAFLISASTPIAARVELHDHIMENDVMKMREVPSIAIPAGGTVKLQPGGLHVMFFGVKQALKPGDTFPLTLNFKNTKSITVQVSVMKISHDPNKHHHCH